MTVLADFIQLGHSNRFGSFALSKSKTSLFNTALNGWMNMIRDVLNQHAIPQLLALNGMSLENHPRLDHEEVNVPDIDAIGNYLKNLSQSGMRVFPNPVLEESVLRSARLPVTRSDEAGGVGQQESDTVDEGTDADDLDDE
jgi:hypothetical protein